MKFSKAVSVATDWIKLPLLTLVSSAPNNLSSVCEASRMTLRGGRGDSRSLSVHSFSVRGQLVLPGPSLSQWCCGRCACVSALSRVIAMCQRAWPSLQISVCCLSDHVSWLSGPLHSFPFHSVLRCWLLFWTHSNCDTVYGTQTLNSAVWSLIWWLLDF